MVQIEPHIDLLDVRINQNKPLSLFLSLSLCHSLALSLYPTVSLPVSLRLTPSPCPSGCHWILPTSLWAGLVVTSLLIIILIYIYWRAKDQSYMPGVYIITANTQIVCICSLLIVDLM